VPEKTGAPALGETEAEWTLDKISLTETDAIGLKVPESVSRSVGVATAAELISIIVANYSPPPLALRPQLGLQRLCTSFLPVVLCRRFGRGLDPIRANCGIIPGDRGRFPEADPARYIGGDFPHAIRLNAMLTKNQIICCGHMNAHFLKFHHLIWP